MKPSDPLRAEHDAILAMLDVLTGICARLESDQEVPKAHLAHIIEFFQVFADRCHHAKEEEVLFPAYQSVGVANEGGPIGVMLAEHRDGRQAIAGMVEGLADLDQEGPAAFVSHARRYIGLLTQHIRKENRVLFPMGDAALPAGRHAAILREFDRLEETRIGSGKHEAFHRLLETLEAAYPGRREMTTQGG